MARKEVLYTAVCAPCRYSEEKSNGLLRCINPRFSLRMKMMAYSPNTKLYDALKSGGQTKEIDRIDRTGQTCFEAAPIIPGIGKVVKGDLHQFWGKPIRTDTA